MTLIIKYSDQINRFLKVTTRLSANKYVVADGGNAAWKLDEDLILITPTKMNKGDISKEDMVFIDRQGKTVEGIRPPTGEKPIYLKFFRERPDITSIIHCHPPCVCALAMMEDCDVAMRPLHPETVIEIGPVPIVPYAQPLTEELADNFSPFLQKYNSFIMENHGLVTMGTGDIYSTLHQVELFENSVDSILRVFACGKLKEMNRKAVHDLGEVMKARHLPLVGAPGANKTLESLYFND